MLYFLYKKLIFYYTKLNEECNNQYMQINSPSYILLSSFIFLISLLVVQHLISDYYHLHEHIYNPVNNVTNIHNHILIINSSDYWHNLRGEHQYIKYINNMCPSELDDNLAGKEGLYFNTSNLKIKRSIIKKYFHHCGAWCLFDYTDPRKGWFWNSILREWVEEIELYKLCPADEFHYVINRFFRENYNLE